MLHAMRVPLRHDMYVYAAGALGLWISCKVLGWLWRVAASANGTGANMHLTTTRMPACMHNTLGHNPGFIWKAVSICFPAAAW